MPSAIEIDRENADIILNGDIHLKSEVQDLVSQTKHTGTTIVDVIKAGFFDKTGNIGEHTETRSIRDDINKYPMGKPYSVSLRNAPVTVERVPYYPKDGDKLVDAGTARVNIAASNDAPGGTTQGDWAKKHQHKTVVQQHVEYFDPDDDGVIWPRDTYNGFRGWGWAFPLCLFATFVIHAALSYPTCPSWAPDPAFRLYVANMHKDKHGSDSMSYDNEGRFKPQNFEDMFAKYDRDNKGGLDITDLARMLKGQRMAMDFFGWSAAFLEWLAVYLLLWPSDGICRKEDIRRIFDGSIFQHKADEYAGKRNRMQMKKRAS